MAQRVFSFFSFWWRHNVISLNCLCFFRSGDAHNNQACDDVTMIEYRHCSGKVSEGKKEKTAKWRRKPIKENSGQMKRDRPLFCFLVIRSFNSRAFSECVCVCVCVCSGIRYTHTAVYVLFKTQNWKKRRTISRRVGWGETKETRRRERGGCVCVC